jgi:hypothetical protein
MSAPAPPFRLSAVMKYKGHQLTFAVFERTNSLMENYTAADGDAIE